MSTRDATERIFASGNRRGQLFWLRHATGPAEPLQLLAIQTLLCMLEHHQWRLAVKRCPDRKRTRWTEDQVGIGKAVHVLDRMARPKANMKTCKQLQIERFFATNHETNVAIGKRFDNLSHPTGIFGQRIKVLAIFPRCIVAMPYMDTDQKIRIPTGLLYCPVHIETMFVRNLQMPANRIRMFCQQRAAAKTPTLNKE